LISWVTGFMAVSSVSNRSVDVQSPPFQPRSALCLARSTVTVMQPVIDGI
jgi:hypothetical protein